MKKIILCLIMILIFSSVSVVFAVSGANDFKVPGNFLESNADTSLANYNDKEPNYNLHLKISQHDSLDEAKELLYDPNGYTGSISSFYDSKYGDQGYEEIIEVNGKYYYVGVYSTGGHLESNVDSVVEEAHTGIEEFNELNSVTPVST